MHDPKQILQKGAQKLWAPRRLPAHWCLSDTTSPYTCPAHPQAAALLVWASGSLCCTQLGWHWDLEDKELEDREAVFSIERECSSKVALFLWRSRGYLCLGNPTKKTRIHNCRSSLQPGVWIIHFPASDINPFSAAPSTTSSDVWGEGGRHFYYFYLVCGHLVFLTVGYIQSSCAWYSQDLYQLTILALISPLLLPLLFPLYKLQHSGLCWR